MIHSRWARLATLTRGCRVGRHGLGHERLRAVTQRPDGIRGDRLREQLGG